MAKITDPDQLVVGTELTVNTAAKTFRLNVAGNYVAKDGVSAQALYSKFVELWTTSNYNKYPFPGYVIGDPRAGMFAWGFDGASYNGWAPADAATRQGLRDAGWAEYAANGALTRQHVGVVSLGNLSANAQPYYQLTATGAPANTTFTDEVNEGLQVFGDAGNGGFDSRTFFKLYCREYGQKYAEASLTSIGESSSGPWKIGLPLTNEADIKILANDATVSTNTPYTNVSITFYGADQNRSIGGSNYPFTIIIDGASANAEAIYTKVQYLLRQSSDIDAGANTTTGKTCVPLLYFVGDTLYTTNGVFIDNYNSNDINRITFYDKNGVARTFPYTAAGTINFNSFLTANNSGYYRMYFTTNPGGDYGTANAQTVNDSANVAITGTITGASIAFTFAYDTNNQGGRTPATPAGVTVVAGNPGKAKPVVASATITRATGQAITLTAEQDRGYVNP